MLDLDEKDLECALRVLADGFLVNAIYEKSYMDFLNHVANLCLSINAEDEYTEVFKDSILYGSIANLTKDPKTRKKYNYIIKYRQSSNYELTLIGKRYIYTHPVRKTNRLLECTLKS